MRIVALDIRACRTASATGAEAALQGARLGAGMEFLVCTLRTDCGRSASMFGFAEASARGSAELAASLRPFLIGRNVHDRERLWYDMRKSDRFWGHLPVYIWGPIDACLWLLAAEAAGLPLYRYIGAYREQVPVYVSSMFLEGAADYVTEARAAQKAGYAAYKLHPPGVSVASDLDIQAEVRAAVGPDFTLMSDPVAHLSLPDALAYGRGLERLGFAWFEEPMPDECLPALKELTRQLDIPVVGTEVTAKQPYALAQAVAEHAVDAVRADVSWSGGVTAVLKTARLAEAFNMNCEIHTAIFHPLELVNLHLCGAIRNCSYLELLGPTEAFGFGLKGGLPIENGVACLPGEPGLGREFDWNFIDGATIATV